jgi:HlyD family secretion protein
MRDGNSMTVEQTMAETAAAAGRKRRRLWLVGVGLTLLVAALGSLAVLRPENGTTHYQTQAVRQGDLSITVSATGNLEATNQVEVGSELSGIITRMTADFNDTVTAGQPLAYLNDVKFKAAVMKSRAELASAEAAYKETLATREVDQKQLQRYRKARALTDGKLPSLGDLEQAEAQLARSTAAAAAAAAAIEVAKATLQSNEADLEKTIIYAPINGIVLSRNVEPGQTVAASLQAPVLYVLAEDLRRMELQVDVDEADVGQVREGQTATFTVDAYPDRSFEARIVQVRYGAETTDGVVTYKTVLSVDNPDLLLRPGMTATADITVLKVDKSLLVPNAALRFAPAEGRAEAKESRSLLDSLLPRPRRRQSAPKNAGAAAPDTAGGLSRVWVVRDNRPVPVAVKKIATDGALTAVESADLQAGTELIVNAIATRK